MSGVVEIAIVGSGPSGFYAAEALLRSGQACRIDMFERLAMPYGLVRYGVAPDHQKLKSVAAVFERIGATEGLRWFGGVDVGRHLRVAELFENYHAVLVACGTPSARKLDVPGEDLTGVCTSTALVGWYNGHPDFVSTQPLTLAAKSAVVLGHGNVAIDVTRLLSKSTEDLATSDIPNAVLNAFQASRVRTVHLVGRGAPGRAKFTPKELRELGELPDVRVTFPQGVERLLNSLSVAPGNTDLLPVWRSLAQHDRPNATREIRVWFGLGAAAFLGKTELTAVSLRVTDSDFAIAEDVGDLSAGHAISCIGYRGDPIADVPFDLERGIIPNVLGRVVDASECRVRGLYVTGWIKRGPTGVIGTNRADSLETAGALLEDVSELTREPKPGRTATEALLRTRDVRTFSFSDWRQLDVVERARARAGAPREKLLSEDEVIAALATPGD